MNFLKCVVAVLIGAGVLAVGSASASEVLYDSAGFIRGQQSGMESFNVSGPGTLTVELTNVAFPMPLSSLNATVSSPAWGLLGPEMGEGVQSYQVTSGGEIFAQWFGNAQGPLDMGMYALKIEYTQSAIPVPLPTSIALLVSGLALLGWQRRRANHFQLQEQLSC
jgi:hypothetical protein